MGTVTWVQPAKRRDEEIDRVVSLASIRSSQGTSRKREEADAERETVVVVIDGIRLVLLSSSQSTVRIGIKQLQGCIGVNGCIKQRKVQSPR